MFSTPLHVKFLFSKGVKCAKIIVSFIDAHWFSFMGKGPETTIF